MFPSWRLEVKEYVCSYVAGADGVLFLKRYKIRISGIGIGLLIKQISGFDRELPTALEIVSQRHIAKEQVFP